MASDPDAPGTRAAVPDETTETSPLLSGAGSGPGPATDAVPETPRIVLSPWRGVAVGLSLWAMMLLQTTNFSGMAMVQGAIAEDLDAHENPMWLSTAFFIPVSALAPFVGRLATIFPPRALLLPISVLIAVGSIVSGLARTTAAFIVGRAVAGAGSAGVLSLVVVFVLEMTTGRNRGVMVGLVNAGMTIGVSIGAIMFGGLLPVIGWRPLFWSQAPVSLLAGLGVYLSIPAGADNTKAEGESETLRQKLNRIDYVGAILLTSTIILFLFGLADEIQTPPLLLSLVSLIAFICIEKLYATDPIIPLNVLFSRGALLTCLGQLGFMSARWTILFYSPIFMLAVRGVAPAAAGSILISTNLGFGIGGLLVGWLHVRRNGSFWLPSVVSMTGFAGTLFVAANAGIVHSSIAVFTAIVFANGFTTGAALNYTLAHLLHLTHDRDAQYVATSLMATFRSFAGSFGTAIGGGIFYRLLRSRLVHNFLELDGGKELTPARQKLVARLLTTPTQVFHGGLSGEAQGAAIEGYSTAMKGLWQAAGILALLMVLVQAGTGWEKPSQDKASMQEEEARINVTEHESVAEA